MKPILPLLILTLAAAPLALHAEEKTPVTPAPKTETKPAAKPGRFKWYTSIKAARKQAAEEKKPIVMLFTGSDWCPYCVKLEKEVLTQKVFKEWAANNAILYLADSKGGPGKESSDGRAQKEKYAKGAGYPCVIITDTEGTHLGKTGYTGATPAEYVKALDAIIAKKE